MACDPSVITAPEQHENRLDCTLALAGGPAQLTANLAGTAGSESAVIRIEDQEVAALAVHTSYEIAGDLTGTWDETTWFATTDWLPVRIERTLHLNGLATFSEESTLELISVQPQR